MSHHFSHGVESRKLSDPGLQLLIGLLIQPRVLDGDGKLIGQSLQDGEIVLAKGVGFDGLHIQHTDGLPL